MTPEQARMTLYRYKLCTVHGCELIESLDAGLAMAGIDASYCPKCVSEDRLNRQSRIAEAKKVLGL